VVKDERAHPAHQITISGVHSRVAICVIPTKEAAVIARHTARIIQK
jgi:acetate kinase